MEFLFEKYGLNNAEDISEVARLLKDFLPNTMSYMDNRTIKLHGNLDSPDEYDLGLNFLKQNGMIEFKKVIRPSVRISILIKMLNRYNLELLNKELVSLIIDPEMDADKRRRLIRMPNLVYYETKTGKIIINGKSNTLEGTNKRLFDTLFIAHPEYADRKRMEKLAVVGKRDKAPSKVALSEAFSNLRSACGVTAKTISLNDHGGKLDANAYPLSAQML